MLIDNFPAISNACCIANPESDFRERPYDLLQTAFSKKN